MNPENPLVSVIIPTYNHGKFIEEAIKSVLAQTYKNTEIIVIDDGSTDETRRIVEAFKERVCYYYQSNKGESAARNLGINRAHGELLAFLDADDIWLENKLDLQIQKLANNPHVGMVACGANFIDESGNYVGRYIPKNIEKHQNLLKALYFCQIIPGGSSGVLIRKNCFEAVGQFDESIKIGEDWDMWLRIGKKFKIYFVEEPLVLIRRVLNKPEFRNPLMEERDVSKVIEKNIPGGFKRRAYGNLFCRLGQYYLSISKKKEAFKYFVRSIWQCPTPLYPNSLKELGITFRDYRYYLLMKCIISI